MIEVFKNKLFTELAESCEKNFNKEQIANFFSHVEEHSGYFKDKGTFLSDYLSILEFSDIKRYLTDLDDSNLEGTIVVKLLNLNFYDLNSHSDFEDLVSEYVLIGDEENTADYFEGMMTNDPFKKFLLYEMHFGKNHSRLTRIGTLAFDDDEYFKCSSFEIEFWEQNLHEFEKFTLNGTLENKLAPKGKSKPLKI